MNRKQDPRLPHLLRMKSGQIRQLRQWLVTENVTYQVAIQRLWKRFAVKASIQQASAFYHRVCTPKPSVAAKRILLDLHLDRTKSGWRVKVALRSPEYRIFVNGKKLKAAQARFVKQP